jgi:hypothetical protein
VTRIPLGISLGVGFLGHMPDLCLVFLRSLHIVFQSVCTSLHSHQECMRVPFSPHPCQHLLVVVFLMTDVLIGVRGNLSMILNCISFMARDGEHCFMWIFFLPLKVFCLVQLFISLLVH